MKRDRQTEIKGERERGKWEGQKKRDCRRG